MYKHLKSLGIQDFDTIEKYSLRSESEYDILKVYYKKIKGELFARSEKFKYPRQQKRVRVDSGNSNGYQNVTEISPSLRYVVEELDQVCNRVKESVDTKKKIMNDLRHLERVVASKIAEIEADLEQLK